MQASSDNSSQPVSSKLFTTTAHGSELMRTHQTHTRGPHRPNPWATPPDQTHKNHRYSHRRVTVIEAALATASPKDMDFLPAMPTTGNTSLMSLAI